MRLLSRDKPQMPRSPQLNEIEFHEFELKGGSRWETVVLTLSLGVDSVA